MTLGPFANGPNIQTGGGDGRFPSSRERRGESVAPPPRLSRWDRDRLRWCTLATPGIGPGRSRPRHACRNLGGRGPVACVSGLHAPGDGTGVLLQHWNHRTRSMAYLQRYNVALVPLAVRSGPGRGVGDGTGMRGSRLHGNDGGNRCYTQTGEPSPAWNSPQECVGAANF